MSFLPPSIKAGLAALTIVAGLSQLPAKAQVNALQQLSRQMIGSSFSDERPTSMPASSNLVDKGSLQVDRVVGHVVDEEIRRRPAPAQPTAGRKSGPPTVQLIVPVKTGLEFARIQQLVPGAKILEMQGGVYVLVGETAQALPAYKLGRSLQAKLGVTFQLAYSSGHPDLNLAWMGGVTGEVAAAPKPKPAAATTETQAKEPAQKGTARDLGVLEAKAPWTPATTTVAAASTSPGSLQAVATKPPAKVESAITTTAAARTSLQPTPAETPKTQETPVAAAATTPSILQTAVAEPAAKAQSPVTTTAVAARTSLQPAAAGALKPQDKPVLAANTSPSSLQTVAAEPPAKVESAVTTTAATRTSLRATLTELRGMRKPEEKLVTAKQEERLPAAPVREERSAQLIKAVAIQPPTIGGIAVVSSRFMATNKDLAYVYVKIRNQAELADVNRVANVAVLHQREDQLLARVGVYNNTRLGQRLRDRQLEKLKQQGYSVELIAGHSVDARSNQA